ncbi:sensor histidine kinase [Chitinophaga defluvii]|uniref:Signal transduction histidine kinase n=1 Tax=Chitinophaga defluvii TaxID=3163343 RepID=A0ABV2TBX0_9BACT
MHIGTKYMPAYKGIRLLLRQGLLLLLLMGMSWQVRAQSTPMQKLQQLLTQQHDSIAYVDVLSQISMLYHLSNADSCLWYALKVKEISERLQYKKGIAEAWNLESICHALNNNFKLAVQYEYTALQMFRAMGDSIKAAQVLNNLGVYYYNYVPGDKSYAFDYLYQSMDIMRKLPPPADSQYVVMLQNYVDWFREYPAKKDSVKWAIATARQIMSKYPGSRSIYYMDITVADSLMNAGKGKAAEALVNALADKALGQGLVLIAINMYEHLDTYRKENKYLSDSIFYWEKIYHIGKAAGYSDLQTATLSQLYQYYSSIHHSEKISYYMQEMIQQARRVQQQLLHPGISYMDYFLKTGEQATLQNDKKQQAQQLEQQRREDNYYWAVVFILIAVVGLVSFIGFTKYTGFKEEQAHKAALARTTITLADKRLQLEANDDFKNKLITIIANDFRLPLQHIVEVSALIRSRTMGQVEMMEMIEQIAASSRNTLVVFDNILRWIKSQLSGFVYTPQPCFLHSMMMVAMDSVGSAAAEKQVKIFNHLPENLTVTANREMLQFVHRHLLEAAVTASAIKSTIIIVARQEDGGVYVSITLRTKPCLRGSEPYWFQLNEKDKSQPALQHDTRLMLIICKDFMTKMDGQIWAADKPEDSLSFIYFLREGR